MSPNLTPDRRTPIDQLRSVVWRDSLQQFCHRESTPAQWLDHQAAILHFQLDLRPFAEAELF